MPDHDASTRTLHPLALPDRLCNPGDAELRTRALRRLRDDRA